MFLVVTIDTEEDNWGQYTERSYSLKNLQKIHGLQSLFDRYGVRPTYLINYPVATDPLAIELFSHFLTQGKCEIGMHCHPWNTPPFEESLCSFNSMLCNLPEQLQYRKLKALKNAICGNFGIIPVSFRAGRWSFGSSTARSIQKLGLKIDTSVTSYTNWGGNGVDYSRMPPRPYRFCPDNVLQSDNGGELLEYPASVGFLQNHYDLCCRAEDLLKKKPFKQIRLCGILDRLRILNKVALSPETSSGKSMIDLARRFEALGINYLNLFFHSNSLVKGVSPFNRSDCDTRKFFDNLEQFLQYAREAGMERSLLKEVRLGDFYPCGGKMQGPDTCCGTSPLHPEAIEAGILGAEARAAMDPGNGDPPA